MAKSISRYLADISSTSGVLDGTLSTAAQTNITSLGTLSSLTVSGAMNGTLSTAAQPNITSVGTLSTLAMGGSITRTGDLTLDVSGTLILDSDDGDLQLKDGGTQFASLYKSSNDFIVRSMISDGDFKIQGNDGGSTINALTLDMSEAGKATFNAGIVAGGLTYPTSDGSNGQVLKTNGSGTLSFADDSGTTINSNTNNYVITGTGTANTLQGESGLTFDGTTLALGQALLSHPTSSAWQTLQIKNSGDGTQSSIEMYSSDGSRRGIYYAASSAQGFLKPSDAGWNFQLNNSGAATFYGSLNRDGGSALDINDDLTVQGTQISQSSSNEWLAYNGSGTSPYIRMKTSGTNNGYIQFTTTSSYFWNDRINRGIRLSNTSYPEFYNGSAYQTMWHNGNAPIAVNGANNVLKANGSGYLQIDNWIRVDGGTGLYTDVSNGAYFFESTGPAGYEGWKVRSRSSGSVSLIMQQNDGTQTGHIYAGTDSNRYQQGFLKSGGGWAAKSDANANWIVDGTVYDSSDARLKSNVQPISNALTKVTQLKGVTYTRNSTMKTEIGMIAQDVKAVVPELVEIMEGEDNKYEVPDMHTMSYERVVPLLIEAIKELKAQLDAK